MRVVMVGITLFFLGMVGAVVYTVVSLPSDYTDKHKFVTIQKDFLDNMRDEDITYNEFLINFIYPLHSKVEPDEFTGIIHRLYTLDTKHNTD